MMPSTSSWSALSIVFIVLALAGVGADLFSVITHGNEPKLLRDMIMMAFSYFFVKQQSTPPAAPTGTAN